jgi:anti-anti-sigma factor
MDELETGGDGLLRVTVAHDGDRTVVVTLRGELDLSNIEQLEHAVEPALTPELDRLVLKGEGLEFADSSAIALWMRWASRVPHFELHDLSPLLRRVLSSMGLDERLELRP